MRRILRNRWALAGLAMLLLLATSGITISRMTCMMSGHSVLSLGMADDCCPEEEHEGQSLQATCCDMVQAGGERVELVPSTLQQFAVLPFVGSAPDWQCTVETSQPLRWLESRPPPLACRARLVLESRFLI